MRKTFKWVAISMLLFVLAACGNNNDTADKEKGDTPLQVVTSFTILQDMVGQIGGDLVETHNLVPVGTDPHEYEPLPEDIKKATDADALFYNGLNLEGGDSGWFAKLVDSVGKEDEAIFEIAKDVDPMYVSDEDGAEQENPHAFLDPNVGIQMAEAIRDALIEIDPDHKTDYEENAASYLETLKDIEKTYEEKIADIPEEDRILITSERAYQYLADRYGLKEGYIWSVDTEENGTPEQITSLIEFIKENEPPVLFVESNVDTRPMETVSKESGVAIFEDPLFSDEIGKQGEEGDTYVKYLEYNIEKIHDGLTE